MIESCRLLLHVFGPDDIKVDQACIMNPGGILMRLFDRHGFGTFVLIPSLHTKNFIFLVPALSMES
jgi:hypothetical protein